ncbi:hypothetical protein [Noviherbaspirillum aerium]|uniref:hypothetical protein n=1 Tax=Noviherbaspirillum aerium TaxID=2588497 RepID=UPI00124EBBB5|nr:hypothetical protein [Noviherbaspirillum aerium]
MFFHEKTWHLPYGIGIDVNRIFYPALPEELIAADRRILKNLLHDRRPENIEWAEQVGLSRHSILLVYWSAC